MLETKEQFKLLRNPVATWPGTGSAAYPSQLFVNSNALEFYEGWSDEFDRAWGRIFTAENKSDFNELFTYLKASGLSVSDLMSKVTSAE